MKFWPFKKSFPDPKSSVEAVTPAPPESQIPPRSFVLKLCEMLCMGDYRIKSEYVHGSCVFTEQFSLEKELNAEILSSFHFSMFGCLQEINLYINATRCQLSELEIIRIKEAQAVASAKREQIQAEDAAKKLVSGIAAIEAYQPIDRTKP